jgi:hypothetical protein
LGESKTAATAQVTQHGCSIWVISQDGHHFTVTADASTSRVDVTINEGVVTSVGVY